MPAFTFEKIGPPTRREQVQPNTPPVRRGALVRILDRLTSQRLQKSEGEIRKAQTLKQKYRKKK